MNHTTVIVISQNCTTVELYCTRYKILNTNLFEGYFLAHSLWDSKECSFMINIKPKKVNFDRNSGEVKRMAFECKLDSLVFGI